MRKVTTCVERISEYCHKLPGGLNIATLCAKCRNRKQCPNDKAVYMRALNQVDNFSVQHDSITSILSTSKQTRRRSIFQVKFIYFNHVGAWYGILPVPGIMISPKVIRSKHIQANNSKYSKCLLGHHVSAVCLPCLMIARGGPA